MRLGRIIRIGGAAGMITLAIAACGSASATVVFSEDFNAGASSAWGNERGNWRDTGGVYDATNPDNSPITYSSVTTLPGLTDFAVDVDVNDLDDGGIWLRSAFNGGTINGVLLVTGGLTGSNSGVYWHTVQNGSFSGILQSVGSPGLQDSDVHIRIEVVGDFYSAFLNGSATPLTTLTTGLFQFGSAGLYDFSPTSGAMSPRGQTFDNFVITDLSIPEPLTLGLFGFGLAGLAFSMRRRTATRNGPSNRGWSSAFVMHSDLRSLSRAAA